MPKVFISYSHDSEEHVRRVRQLADRLRQDNVDTVLDQYEPAPPEGWPHWMDRQLDEADFVLVVCTPRYTEKAKEPHRSGVRFEGVLILQELYDSGMWNDRFIPILYGEVDPRSIIRPLRAYTRYQVDTEEGYQLLLRRLTANCTPLKSQGTSKSSPPPEEAHSGLTSIPKLPPNYLPRNEYIAALRSALLATDTRSLGITGEGTVGLLGMGGIGKSVLAAAVARDSAIREAFGDRIYWLVLGQEPNLLSLQEQLARALEGSSIVFKTYAEGQLLLSRLLEDSRTLIVLDDVWHLDHAAIFDVLGPLGKLLITTRNSDVLAGLGAKEHKINLLSPEQATELIAAWANESPERLPASAKLVIEECGFLPLALAMIGAAVRRRNSAWEDLLERLRKADLGNIKRSFPNYPYPTLLRALEVSVEALPMELRDRYYDLAVFPEDTGIPAKTLEILWAEKGFDEYDARASVDEFVARSLAQWHDQKRITLHDLQLAYLKRKAGDLRPLNQRLIRAYKSYTKSAWPIGPNDGYFFQLLPHHLLAAGGEQELRDLLLDFRWIHAKLTSSSIGDVLADYALVPNDSAVAAVRSALQLSAHIVATDPTELRFQLHARLGCLGVSEVEKLLAGSLAHQEGIWLRPLASTLFRAGGPLIRVFRGRGKPVTALLALASGNLVVGCDDGHIELLGEDGSLIAQFRGHASEVCAIVTNKSDMLITGGHDGKLLIFDLTHGERRELDTGALQVKALTLFRENWVMAALSDHSLALWNYRAGQPEWKFRPRGAILDLATLPGTSLLVAACTNGLQIIDMEKKYAVARIDAKVNAIAVTEVAIIGCDDRGLHSFSFAGREDPGREDPVFVSLPAKPTALLALSGRRCMVGCSDGALALVDVGRRKIMHFFAGHSEEITALSLTADHLLFSASRDGMVRAWNLKELSGAVNTRVESQVVEHIAFANGGRGIALHKDGRVSAWDLGQARRLESVKGHFKRVKGMVGVGDRVVLARRGGRITFWELANGKAFDAPYSVNGEILSLAALDSARVVFSYSEPWEFDEDGRPLNDMDDNWVGILDLTNGSLVYHDWCRVSFGSDLAVLDGRLLILSPPHRRGKDLEGLIIYDTVRGEICGRISISAARFAVAREHLLAYLPFSGVNVVRIFDLQQRREVSQAHFDFGLTAIRYNKEMDILVIGDQRGSLHFVRIEG